jgi:hypothetical protein
MAERTFIYLDPRDVSSFFLNTSTEAILSSDFYFVMNVLYIVGPPRLISRILVPKITKYNPDVIHKDVSRELTGNRVLIDWKSIEASINKTLPYL